MSDLNVSQGSAGAKSCNCGLKAPSGAVYSCFWPPNSTNHTPNKTTSAPDGAALGLTLGRIINILLLINFNPILPLIKSSRSLFSIACFHQFRVQPHLHDAFVFGIAFTCDLNVWQLCKLLRYNTGNVQLLKLNKANGSRRKSFFSPRFKCVSSKKAAAASRR